MREFPTLICWLEEWARVRSLALSAKGLNPAPLIVDSSLPELSRYDRFKENELDLGKIVGPRYLKAYDHDMLYAWLVGKVMKLPTPQIRRIRKETMRAAKIEGRKRGARYCLRPYSNGDRALPRYEFGDWGLKRRRE